MKIGSYYEGMTLFRREKAIIAHLQAPHRVLSTCRFNGGLREDLEYLFNHQSCEPTNHTGIDLCQVAVREPERYQKRICGKAGIPHESAAGLGTAANMNNAGIGRERYGELEVIAVTTAGVGTNGARAGDPASYAQTESGPQALGRPTPVAGTINTLLFVNQTMTPGALVVAATLLAEAKASVLQELSAPSRYSDGIATGTGTDQIGIACLLETPIQHTDANKHSKLGELIALAARSALRRSLVLQSGLGPDSRRSCLAQLQRFGETQESFIEGVCANLPAEQQALFRSNFLSANHDPMTVAAVQACIHLKDQIAWGVLPESCGQELMVTYGAQIASAACGRSLSADSFREAMAEGEGALDNPSFLQLIRRAIACGYAQKWLGRFED